MNPDPQTHKTLSFNLKLLLKKRAMNLMPSLKGLLLLLLMFGTSSRVTAQTYNAAADFSIASNPNGVWSYGTTGTTLTGPLTLFTNVKIGIGGIPTWNGWEGTQTAFTDNYPLVGKNFSATNGAASDIVLLPGQLALHPAPNDAFAVTRFTAPATASYQLNALFEGREFQGGTPATNTDVHILVNGGAIYTGAVVGFGPSSDQAFATLLSLNTGDRVDFSVGYGSDSTFLGDTTALAATISTVPEPSTIVFGVFGLACMLLRRNRNKPRA